MKFEAAGQTDTGRVREHNEDNLRLSRNLGLFVVADGMGGQLAGEVASRMAVEMIEEYLEYSAGNSHAVPPVENGWPPEANRLAMGIRLANQAIFEAGQRNPAWRNMGTTVVATLVEGNRLLVAHVGDSRCYLIRHEAITQLTNDHSLVAEQVRKGLLSPEEAAVSRMKNVITRALGALHQVEIDMSEHLLLPGDHILLCSDGLTNMVSDEEIVSVATKAASPQEACATLIDAANQRGGKDNITLILIACKDG